MFGRTLDWQDELGHWLTPFLDRLGHKARRRMCPFYVSGLIGPGDRTSIQPMARRLARCVVPWTSFCEYAATTPQKTPTWFVFKKDCPLAVFGGIWTSWNGTRGTKANHNAGGRRAEAAAAVGRRRAENSGYRRTQGWSRVGGSNVIDLLRRIAVRSARNRFSTWASTEVP